MLSSELLVDAARIAAVDPGVDAGRSGRQIKTHCRGRAWFSCSRREAVKMATQTEPLAPPSTTGPVAFDNAGAPAATDAEASAALTAGDPESPVTPALRPRGEPSNISHQPALDSEEEAAREALAAQVTASLFAFPSKRDETPEEAILEMRKLHKTVLRREEKLRSLLTQQGHLCHEIGWRKKSKKKYGDKNGRRARIDEKIQELKERLEHVKAEILAVKLEDGGQTKALRKEWEKQRHVVKTGMLLDSFAREVGGGAMAPPLPQQRGALHASPMGEACNEDGDEGSVDVGLIMAQMLGLENGGCTQCANDPKGALCSHGGANANKVDGDQGGEEDGEHGALLLKWQKHALGAVRMRMKKEMTQSRKEANWCQDSATKKAMREQHKETMQELHFLRMLQCAIRGKDTLSDLPEELQRRGQDGRLLIARLLEAKCSVMGPPVLTRPDPQVLQGSSGCLLGEDGAVQEDEGAEGVKGKELTSKDKKWVAHKAHRKKERPQKWQRQQNRKLNWNVTLP